MSRNFLNIITKKNQKRTIWTLFSFKESKHFFSYRFSLEKFVFYRFMTPKVRVSLALFKGISNVWCQLHFRDTDCTVSYTMWCEILIWFCLLWNSYCFCLFVCFSIPVLSIFSISKFLAFCCIDLAYIFLFFTLYMIPCFRSRLLHFLQPLFLLQLYLNLQGRNQW